MLSRYLISLMCFMAGFFIGFRACRKAPDTAIVTQIKNLHDTVYQYQPEKFRPTIKEIQTRYRTLLDTVERITYDSTWSNICGSYGLSEEKQSCQRQVVRRLLSGDRDSALLSVYQSQRAEDSMQIGYLMKLDSLNSEALKSLQNGSKVSEHHSRVDRLKQAGKIALGTIVGFIVGRL